MGWKTAGKQQSGVNGGASKGLEEVGSALTHAAAWTMVRAASTPGEASGDGPDAGETISPPPSPDIWRNTSKADRVLISSPLSASPQS